MDKVLLTPAMRKWLLDQMALWRERKLVSRDQADAILDLYETPRQSSARQQSTGIYILLGVAAFFVGLALLLAIGYNWEGLPAAVKLIIIFAVVSGTYTVAFLLRFKARAKIFSEIVFFLGALFYGASIGLIAQIFHLNAHYPDAFWWWALGVLPLALFLDTFLMHLLLVALLATWVGTEILGFQGLGAWFFGRFPALPNGCYSLPVFVGLGLARAYHRKSPLTVALYVPLIVWWVILQPFAWRWDENPIFFIGGMGAVLLILAEAHEQGSRFAIPYRLWGVLTCMVVLSILGFGSVQSRMAHFDNALNFFLQSVLVSALGVAAFVLAVIMQARRTAGRPFAQPLSALVTQQWLPLAMLAMMFALTAWFAVLGDHQFNRFDRADPVVIVPTVVANLAMLGLAFWLLLVGVREERGGPFAGGVFYFLLWSAMRYADLFGDFGGMLGASFMFLLCGASLAGFALFWHSRKKKIRPARQDRDLPESVVAEQDDTGPETAIQGGPVGARLSGESSPTESDPSTGFESEGKNEHTP